MRTKRPSLLRARTPPQSRAGSSSRFSPDVDPTPLPLMGLSEAVFPVAWPAFHVHDGHDQHPGWLVHVEHRIRKDAGEVPADGGFEEAKAVRLLADLADEAFDLVV